MNYVIAEPEEYTHSEYFTRTAVFDGINRFAPITIYENNIREYGNSALNAKDTPMLDALIYFSIYNDPNSMGSTLEYEVGAISKLSRLSRLYSFMRDILQEPISIEINDEAHSESMHNKSWEFDEGEIEDWDTDPLPPKRVVSMKGRLVHTRKGRPAPFDINEEGW